MKEVGQVVKVNNTELTIRITKKDECSKCGLCGMKKDENSYDFTIENNSGYEVGDSLELEINDYRGYSIFFAFILPILMLAIGIVIGVILNSELLMVVMGITMVVIAYTVGYFTDKYLKTQKQFKPKIIKKIESDKEKKW